jgi:hypothetical protein
MTVRSKLRIEDLMLEDGGSRIEDRGSSSIAGGMELPMGFCLDLRCSILHPPFSTRAR